jgi:hypothetical protein
MEVDLARPLTPMLGGRIAAGDRRDAQRFEWRFRVRVLGPESRRLNTLPISNSRTRTCCRAVFRASADTSPGSNRVRIMPSSALSGLASATVPWSALHVVSSAASTNA